MAARGRKNGRDRGEKMAVIGEKQMAVDTGAHFAIAVRAKSNPFAAAPTTKGFACRARIAILIPQR
jgi:hypothetical protein